jgi:cyanate permease
LLALAFSLNAFVSIATHTHLVSDLHDRGYETTVAAAMTGLIGAMQVVGRVILGAIGGRMPLRLIATFTLGIQPIALLALLLVPEIPGLVTFIALFGISRGISTLMRPAFVVELFGRARYATIAGTLAGFVLGATAVAPISGGIAHDLVGDYQPLLWGFVVFSLISAGVMLLIRPAQSASTPCALPARP